MTGLIVFFIVMLLLTIVAACVVTWLSEEFIFGVIAALIGIIITIGSTFMNYYTTYNNDHWAVCHITGKDRGGDEGSYRIYTSDCGQLSNEDSVLRGKYDSADIWQLIPDNGPVELRIAGSRVGFFSQFPNVFGVRVIQG